MRTVLKSKFHSAFGTGANPDYAGSSCRAGLAARILENGDRTIIMAFDLTNEPVEPKMILVDGKNDFVEYREGVKHVQQVH